MQRRGGRKVASILAIFSQKRLVLGKSWARGVGSVFKSSSHQVKSIQVCFGYYQVLRGYSGIQLPFQFTISHTLKMSIEPLLEKVKSNEASSVRLNSTPSVMPYTIVSLVLKTKQKHQDHNIITSSHLSFLNELKTGVERLCTHKVICAQAKGWTLVYFKRRYIKMTFPWFYRNSCSSR